jgi:hypothetical protein
MRLVRKLRSLLTIGALAASLALPTAALGQSAGDEQYTDPFGQEDPAAQEPAPEQPAERPSEQPPSPVEPAPGGNGTAEPASTTEAAQEASPTLPRTGFHVLVLAAIGYALLLAGVAIRRKA